MSQTGENRRRACRRRRLDEHGIVSVRVRPGHDVTLLDVSAGGALVESHHRLLPGASIELHLHTPHHRVAVRGRILRCRVSRLGPASVCYQGAIAFDRTLSWFTDEEHSGYLVHLPNGPWGASDWADATRRLS